MGEGPKNIGEEQRRAAVLGPCGKPSRNAFEHDAEGFSGGLGLGRRERRQAVPRAACRRRRSVMHQAMTAPKLLLRAQKKRGF